MRRFLPALAAHRRACGGEAAASLVEATVRIIGSAFRERHDIPDFGSRTMALHHARLRDAVANRLADPDLSPERLSSEVGLSRSYIHAIMADAGTTLGRLILSMRLDIAFSAGFQDPAHFSRRFSEAYGCAPRAFRAELATGLWAMKS
jgi:AraC-like DNA-binding protein